MEIMSSNQTNESSPIQLTPPTLRSHSNVFFSSITLISVVSHVSIVSVLLICRQELCFSLQWFIICFSINMWITVSLFVLSLTAQVWSSVCPCAQEELCQPIRSQPGFEVSDLSVWTIQWSADGFAISCQIQTLIPHLHLLDWLH